MQTHVLVVAALYTLYAKGTCNAHTKDRIYKRGPGCNSLEKYDARSNTFHSEPGPGIGFSNERI